MRVRYVILLVIILTSCRENTSTTNSEIPIIDLTDLNFTSPLSFSKIVEEIDYVKLETHPSGLIDEHHKIYVSGSRIFVEQHGEVLLFDKNGKYLNRLYSVGKGPSEGFVRCCAVDHINKHFFIYDNFSNMIKIFDFNGEYLDQFNDPQKKDYYVRNMSVFNNYVILGNEHLMPSFFSVFNITHPDSVVYSYNNQYPVITRPLVLFESNHYINHFQDKDTVFLFKEQYCDTLFYTSNFKELHPRYIFQWNPIQKADYVTAAKFRSREIYYSNIFEGVYRIISWSEINQYLFFVLLTEAEKRVKYHLGIYDNIKRTLHLSNDQKIINDIDGGVDLILSNFTGIIDTYSDQIYISVFPHELIDAFAQNKSYISEQKRKRLGEFINSLSEEDNPVLMVLKIKNNDY